MLNPIAAHENRGPLRRASRAAWRLCLLVALVLSAPASASTALDLDVEGLTQRAELVLRAKVTSSASRWAPGGRRILTETRLSVLEVVAGNSQTREVRVIQPGGAVDGVVQEVIGAAGFTPGEEIVVFLEGAGQPTLRVVGMALGKYRIERDEGRAPRARRDGLDEVRVLHPRTRVEQPPQPAVELDALLKRIRAARGMR